jgi:hypothetical protein
MPISSSACRLRSLNTFKDGDEKLPIRAMATAQLLGFSLVEK